MNFIQWWDQALGERLITTFAQLARCVRRLLGVETYQPVRTTRGGFSLVVVTMSLAALSLFVGRVSAAHNDQAEDKSDGTVYEGLVVDKETGKPVRDVRLTVRVYTGRKGLERSSYTTDSDGKFSLALPPDQAALPQLSFVVNTQHDAYIPMRDSYSANDIRRIELTRVDFVTGKLVSHTGKPVGGAKLLAMSAPSVRGFPVSHHRAESQPDGTFRVNIVKDGNSGIYIVPDAHAPKMLVTSGLSDLGEVELETGVPVSGQVLDARGGPISEAWVYIQEPTSQETMSTEVLAVATYLSRSAVTDDDGRFKVAPLAAGQYLVAVANQPGWLHQQWQSGERPKKPRPLPAVFMESGLKIETGVEPLPLRLQAVPHVTITARFSDSAGRKVEPMRFNVGGELNGLPQIDFFRSVMNSGTATCLVPHGLENTRLMISPPSRGYVFRYRRSKDAELKGIAQSARLGTVIEDIADLEIIRHKEPTLFVKVVDSDLRRIEGDVIVSAAYPWGVQPFRVPVDSDVRFRLEPDGRFRSFGLLCDEQIAVRVQATGYEAQSKSVQIAEGEADEMVVVLKRDE